MSTSAIAMHLPAPPQTSRRSQVRAIDHTPPHPETRMAAESADEGNLTPDSPSSDANGLQQIKGIGQSIAQALNSLGVHTYADLTRYTPERLADPLRARIPSISAKRIERDDWLGQARALARQEHETEPSQPETDDQPTPPAAGRKKNAGQASPQRWREIADFFFSLGYAIDPDEEEHLRTKAHHSQSDKSVEWDGVATDQLINWMLDQADLPTPDVPAPSVAQPHSTEIEILSAALSQTGPSSGVPEKRLLAETSFRVRGPQAERLTTAKALCRVEVHAVNLKSGASTLVASEASPLRPQVFEYTSQQSFPMPAVGRYELHTIVLLLPPNSAMECHQGPTFRIVP